jgi:hypothetical protein
VDRVSARDFRQLRRADLLDDYLQIARSRGKALVATALRNKSVDMRDIFVHGAIRAAYTSAELKEELLAGRLDRSEILDVPLFGELGRLILLQNLLEDDLQYGEAVLSLAHELADVGELSDDVRRVLIQYHILYGNKGTAEKLLDHSPDIDGEFHGYLRAEIHNPFVTSETDSEEWLDSFNALFNEHNMSPITVNTNLPTPFDSIQTDEGVVSEGKQTDGDPLVSVVLTSYRPDSAELVTSVRSILQQTWTNLELIVVDDCSGSAYLPVFRQLNEFDSRIKVLHAPVNRGTYVARNIGYEAASGEFITGQDDDDWSHPERIARQVELMQTDPNLDACRAMAITCDDHMSRCRLGYKPVALNASSLMVRRRVFDQLGGYIESRKAADTEYYLRLKKFGTGRVVDLKEPLCIIRVRSGSLSREEFAAGWRHPARTSFKSAYRYWHRYTTPAQLAQVPSVPPPVQVPARFKSDTPQVTRQLDVVFAGDWQRYGGPQKSMLEEIAALTQAGYRVGIMNLEAARFMHGGEPKPLTDAVQKLINEGSVNEVFYDEDIQVRLLILRYPPILQFFTHTPTALKIRSMIILANQAPSELDGTDVRYLVDDCHSNAEAAFRVAPVWVPQGPQVRDFLKHYLDDSSLAAFDLPGILDLAQWWQDRLWYRSTVPVVGRHSRDTAMKWPAERCDLEALYPTDGTYDVRIMGGHRTPLHVLGRDRVPAAWTAYKRDAVPVQKFLHSLDYFVYFQHPHAVEAFGRAILEALASGIVVILPKHFKNVFGPAALYAEIDEVQPLIQRMHSDFSIYQAQLERSKAILDARFSYSSYIRRIENLIDQPL